MVREKSKPDTPSRYKAYPPPPAGFNPHTAPDTVLQRHGLPRRPDPEREPDLARIWKRVFDQPLEYVKAELAKNQLIPGRMPVTFQPEPAKWAGAVVRNGKPFKWVFAEWVIPGVSTKKSIWAPDRSLAFWVGIDGYSNDQLLQAGVAVTVETKWWRWVWLSWVFWPHTTIKWWAWTEWWTGQHQDEAVEVENFSVKPGDRVGFIVCVLEPESASVFLRNASTGQATSIALSAPPGYASQGDSAEWIVEPRGEAAQFTTVTFNECRAMGATRLANFGDAFEQDLLENGALLIDGGVVEPNSVTVEWKGS